MQSITARTTAARCSVAVVALIAALAGCEAKKSSNPLSPSVAGPIPGVEISAPKLLEPAQGFRFRESEQPIRLTIENASSTGVRPLSYTFEVAPDSGFGTKVFSRAGVAPGGNGRTSVQLDRLEIGRVYFWRVRAEDGANTGPFSSAGFEIFPKPAINPPAAIAPVNNALTANATPTLTVANSATVGPVGGKAYEFQVAADQAFSRLVAAGIFPEGPGQTSMISAPLPAGTAYFWRVRVSDGETTSAWMPTQTFRTPAAAPPPSPGPTPPAPGGPCNASNPETIVSCERAKYGHMSPSQLVSFLRSTAQSLNRNGISGGPFGILRKPSGSSCDGYSCDIICSGQGGSQRQWDVLNDAEGAQGPAWNGPKTPPNIRIDVCEIQ
ncbi:MAG: hypothetical protein HOQ29_09770 [Acidobacteria bacterium]|nr:hypothetical protein [Acidobacteriota bacterium]